MLSSSLLSSLLLAAAIVRSAPVNSSDTIAKRITKRGGPAWVPYYDATANGHTSPARGWNSFGLQANQDIWSGAGFDFNDYHFAQQCENMVVQAGYDYVCSIDSGWSGNGGDQYARIVPDESVFSWYGFQGFAAELASKNIQLGVYLLPGAFGSDANTIIEGTNIPLGDVLDTTQPSFNLRNTFKWGQDGVQQWHDSVVKNLASLGVTVIKLDYMTPGSPAAGEDLPADMSPAATAYHNAILNYGNGMRLDLSWKLSRDAPYWSVWQTSADSLRLDQDVNNSGSKTFVSWATVQRAIENYRIFINQQVLDPSRYNQGIMIRPDMDNMYVGNSQDISGISDVQRYTVAIHWIGAGANLVTGSDLTRLDTLGSTLLYNEEVMDVADFTSQWPMQPRNPDSTGSAGGPNASQTQSWVSGPNESGTAVVVLANYGPDEGSGGFGTSDNDIQLVTVSLDTLGLGGQSWSVRRVLGGGGSGGGDFSDLGVTSDQLSCNLGPGESVLYKLQQQ